MPDPLRLRALTAPHLPPQAFLIKRKRGNLQSQRLQLRLQLLYQLLRFLEVVAALKDQVGVGERGESAQERRRERGSE